MADLPATLVDDLLARYAPVLGEPTVINAVAHRSFLPLDYLEAIAPDEERLAARRPPFANLVRNLDEAKGELARAGALYRFPTLAAAHWPAFRAANSVVDHARRELEWALVREVDCARLSIATPAAAT